MLSGFAVLSVVMAVVASFMGVRSAYAWTHLENNFDCNPQDYACGTRTSTPCLYWAQPSYKSATIHVYLDPSLQNAGSNHYNFQTAANNAFSAFNGVNAYNPFFSGCYTYQGSGAGQCGQAYYTLGYVPACSGAITDTSDYGPVNYSSSLNQYWAVLNTVTVTVDSSTTMTWNQSYTNSCNPTTDVGSYDGRSVIAHETGHAEALGHTNHTTSLMHQGGTCQCSTPQADDIAGLQAIYPGYYPS